MSSVPDGSSRGSSRAIRSRATALARRMSRAAFAACALLVIAAANGASAAKGLHDVEPDVATRVRQLDCSHLDSAEVRDTLARAPAPRIVLLQGSVALVSMESFGRFLAGMGYPADRVRNPRDGTFSYGSFGDSAVLAGEIAFDYEQTGEEPMLIGHSQGGMLAIRTLYELAGAFHEALHVVDPASGQAFERTTIVDPLTRQTRPVVGLHVAYAAALATGWLPRLMLGQWSMIPRLHRIPDTVDEFTGFTVPHDPIAGNLLGVSPYESLGSAQVRNVMLPSRYHHIDLPRTERLAADATVRAWIDAWSPAGAPAPPAGDTTNLVHAADIWYSVKRHWCLQAQRLLGTPAS
jgi:hypothetical protein